MSVTPDNKKIQVEDTSKKRQITEYNLGKISAAVNYILQNNPAQIGDLQESLLDESEFQSRNGTEWILADGRDVTGTKYNNITGIAVAPDCRGLFLRMSDNGAGVDTDRVFLSDQTDDNKAHSHKIIKNEFSSTPGNNARSLTGNTVDGDVRLQGSSNTPTVGLSFSTGGSEARPDNIAFNIFIKIN